MGSLYCSQLLYSRLLQSQQRVSQPNFYCSSPQKGCWRPGAIALIKLEPQLARRQAHGEIAVGGVVSAQSKTANSALLRGTPGDREARIAAERCQRSRRLGKL